MPHTFVQTVPLFFQAHSGASVKLLVSTKVSIRMRPWGSQQDGVGSPQGGLCLLPQLLVYVDRSPCVV